VRRLVDPFKFGASVVDPTIAKGVANSGRGIRVASNSLIPIFNMRFFVSRPLIEFYRESAVAQCILDIWEGHILCTLNSE
jgi:hypothetical protein